MFSKDQKCLALSVVLMRIPLQRMVRLRIQVLGFLIPVQIHTHRILALVLTSIPTWALMQLVLMLHLFQISGKSRPKSSRLSGSEKEIVWISSNGRLVAIDLVIYYYLISDVVLRQ